jgi:hypothetical protein
MTYPTDNPMDGRGLADELDGGVYADGYRVCMRPKRTASGVTMGWTLAEAENEQVAAEIARRMVAFEPLLKMARFRLRSLENELMKVLDNNYFLSPVGLARLNADPVMVKLRADIDEARAAIAKAEGR